MAEYMKYSFIMIFNNMFGSVWFWFGKQNFN